MTYVKKLVLHGFKSFANRTELPFDKAINVIIGPNGSGKSNISDALCFVLGRLSAKSIRAAKASNLIFQGSKERKPSQEASVELVLDNEEGKFNLNSKEINIKRTVRRNGQSAYRINSELKTRQEVLELLAQAGIDPNGFNLVLQGEISRFVKMHQQERRELIEEISGISIYETRKQRSLNEIEKTEEKLREVSAVLRERTAYLKNLENERKQALKFKELEDMIKSCKASIINKKIEEKIKSLELIKIEIEKNQKFKSRIKDESEKINSEILSLENRINEINKFIQKTTGIERDSLNEEVTELNVKIAADGTRKENFEKKISDNEIRKEELEANITDLENELEELKNESPKISKKQTKIKLKKQELERVKDEKDNFYSYQAEINNIKDRIRDKEAILSKIKLEAKSIYSNIESISQELSVQTIEECINEIHGIKKQLNEFEIELLKSSDKKLELEKNFSVFEVEIKRNTELKVNIPNSQTCPLCQVKLTGEHKQHVINEANFNIEKNKSFIEKIQEELLKINKENKENLSLINKLKEELTNKQNELSILNSIEEKKGLIKHLVNNEKETNKEIEVFKSKLSILENKNLDKNSIEERHNKLFFELQELSSVTDENINTSILYKEREMESILNVINTIKKDKNQLEKEILRLSEDLKNNEKSLIKKQKSLQELNESFKKLFDERTKVQEQIKDKNVESVEKQNIFSRFNDLINNHKINIAKISAEKESLEFELNEFKSIKLLSESIPSLEERLKKSEQAILMIGSVNLRALETYDEIKEEYDKIANRTKELENERDGILKIIEEIDKKKKKTFIRTFNELNDLFTRNFSQLSFKGNAFLELEDKENIFNGGVTITIKVAKGKYFDVTSLSGGEQALIALSLIFAIQEYKPYAFYVLDEIDAALDKRNSELLTNLLKKYIQSGQYLIISHNDSVILGADILYGVSMNNGISKVLSLNLKENELDLQPEVKQGL